MPEMRFRIIWPDGVEESCYSPSLIIKEYLLPGAAYPLGDFLTRCRVALKIASDRVSVKYGHSCSLALAQLGRIEARCGGFGEACDGVVWVEGFEE